MNDVELELAADAALAAARLQMGRAFRASADATYRAALDCKLVTAEPDCWRVMRSRSAIRIFRWTPRERWVSRYAWSPEGAHAAILHLESLDV